MQRPAARLAAGHDQQRGEGNDPARRVHRGEYPDAHVAEQQQCHQRRTVDRGDEEPGGVEDPNPTFALIECAEVAHCHVYRSVDEEEADSGGLNTLSVPVERQQDDRTPAAQIRTDWSATIGLTLLARSYREYKPEAERYVQAVGRPSSAMVQRMPGHRMTAANSPLPATPRARAATIPPTKAISITAAVTTTLWTTWRRARGSLGSCRAGGSLCDLRR